MDLTDNKKVVAVRRVKKVEARGKGRKTIGGMLTAGVLPLRRDMVRQLKSRGYNTGKMNWRTIMATYYNEFVTNQHNRASPYVPIDAYEFANHIAFKLSPDDALVGDIANIRSLKDMEVINDVSNNIANVFRLSLLKKRAAVRNGLDPKMALTAEELQQARGAERVIRQLKNKLSDNYAVNIGQLRTLLIVAISFWLLIYLVKK